ncbi:hypothetical protein COEX109129_42350 [Corallococcus exiguus]
MRSDESSITGGRAGWVRTPGSESSGCADISFVGGGGRNGSVGGDTRREGGIAAGLRTATSSVVLRRPPAAAAGAGGAFAGAGALAGAAGARGGSVEEICGSALAGGSVAGSGTSPPRASTCATCVSLEVPSPVDCPLMSSRRVWSRRSVNSRSINSLLCSGCQMRGPTARSMARANSSVVP